MTHVFDEAIRLAARSEHTFDGATHPAYANMVGPFGGILCAVLLNAVLRHPARQGDPIAQTVNFAGPIADGAFEIDARPARTNRSTQHWTLQLRQGDVICTTGSVVLALRRETWSAPEAVPPQDMPPAASLPRTPDRGAVAWVRCYDLRFAPGEAPFRLDGTEQAHSYNRLWIRDEPPRPLDFCSLAAIADNFFPRIFVRRGRPSPVGTITLSTFFHADAALLAAQGDRHLLGTARALSFRHGYFDQSAEVWSDAGQLLASSHQMVYYRE